MDLNKPRTDFVSISVLLVVQILQLQSFQVETGRSNPEHCPRAF